MRKQIIIVLLCGFLFQNLSFALENEDSVQTFKEENFSTSDSSTTETATNTAPTTPIITHMPSITAINEEITTQTLVTNPYDGKEIDTLLLEKGSKFYVKSLQPMSSDTPEGARIQFETQTRLFNPDKLSKVIFTGEVVENNPPRRAGRSSSIKLEISKIKVDNVTYKTNAIVSRMGNKAVHNGMLAGMPIYFTNLANSADDGTVTIDKIYKDPCDYSCTPVSSVVRPLYYFGAGLLQLADLLFVTPIICLFKKGEEIDIPKDSSFEIKLASDIALLKI